MDTVTPARPRLALCPLNARAETRGQQCSRNWGIPLLSSLSADERMLLELLVEVDEKRTYLRLPHAPPQSRFRVAWLGGRSGYRLPRASGQTELILRAMGGGAARGMTLLDCTAGFGMDSALLASSGFRVIAVERHPVLASMLLEALEEIRAGVGCGEILENLDIRQADSSDLLRSGGLEPDIIYLDPMFPERSKSASVKKPMQIMQVLHGSEANDADELLMQALQRARFRVVVKRPLHAPALGGEAPRHQLQGKAIRFDIYTLRSIHGGD